MCDHIERWLNDIREPEWQRKIEAPENISERFRALRALYSAAERNGIDPHGYLVDWVKVFTPIEREVWCDIRCAGIPMCPQYPVGRYFVDFGDPEKKIAIECDGKDWHNVDTDRERDSELWGHGWMVFRFPGKECMRCRRPTTDEVLDALEVGEEERLERRFEQWMYETSEGGVEAIKALFYDGISFHISEDKMVRALESRMLVGSIATHGAI